MSYNFKTGWIRQPHDPRDRYLIIPNHRTATLPPYFDVDFSAIPQLDQGQEGSCGPNTAEEVIYKDQQIESLPLVGASRLFIYYWTRYLMGTVSQDSGVDNRSMLKALVQYGFPPEPMWPYDDTHASMVKKPTQAVVAAAVQNRITDYAAVVQSLTQMQGVLAGGKPFIFGFDVFQQMMSDQASQTGILTDPSPGESPVGGHDVSFVGYTTVDRPGVLPGNRWPANTFKFRNHWTNADRSPWGDGGYGYLSFSYATNAKYASDFWVINTIPGGSPIPPSQQVSVPNVVGMTLPGAKSVLAASGLIATVVSGDATTTVISQSPLSGTQVDTGSIIKLTFGTTPTPPDDPNKFMVILGADSAVRARYSLTRIS